MRNRGADRHWLACGSIVGCEPTCVRNLQVWLYLLLQPKRLQERQQQIVWRTLASD
jgi:hypothetical protein